MFGTDLSDNDAHFVVRPLGDPLPIDRARVAALRRAIAAGTYVVDPDRVAAAMIAADLPPQRRTR